MLDLVPNSLQGHENLFLIDGFKNLEGKYEESLNKTISANGKRARY